MGRPFSSQSLAWSVVISGVAMGWLVRSVGFMRLPVMGSVPGAVDVHGGGFNDVVQLAWRLGSWESGERHWPGAGHECARGAQSSQVGDGDQAFGDGVVGVERQAVAAHVGSGSSRKTVTRV